MAAGADSNPHSPTASPVQSPQQTIYADILALVQNLQQAIRFGDEEQAMNLASQLAKHKAMVNVDICIDKPASNASDEEIRVKVYVEDKDSSGVCVVLKLKPSMTIRQLKSKMLIEYGFPPEVQKWIIGKRIAADDDTLSRCGIKTSGISIFLYLISPKSVGLSKAKILQKYKHLLPAESQILENQIVVDNADNTDSSHGAGTNVRLDSTDATNQSPNEDIRTNSISHVESVESQNTSAPAVAAKKTLPDKTKQKTENKQKEGWSCDMCTFINVPTRPGCEICGHPRPQDYQVPADYVITQEESDRLMAEREAERLARENAHVNLEDLPDEELPVPVERAGEQQPHIQLTEQQLDQLLKLNDLYNAGVITSNDSIDSKVVGLIPDVTPVNPNIDQSSHVGGFSSLVTGNTQRPISSRGLDYSDFGRDARESLLTQPEDYALTSSDRRHDWNLYGSLPDNK